MKSPNSFFYVNLVIFQEEEAEGRKRVANLPKVTW